MQPNLEDTVEDDYAIVPKIIDQHAYTSGPESTSSRASGSNLRSITFRGQKAPLCWWLLVAAGGFAAAGFAAGGFAAGCVT